MRDDVPSLHPYCGRPLCPICGDPRDTSMRAAGIAGAGTLESRRQERLEQAFMSGFIAGVAVAIALLVLVIAVA